MSDIVIEKIVRPERTLSGTWLEVIASNLDYHRAAFLWKCEGLTDAQLRRRAIPPSDPRKTWNRFQNPTPCNGQ